ncbi:hypothetical protein AAHN97_09405 [Chitinophaga niabensis]|uniref:hypothetical protein n=1 Tax=Chitinophaga niabensis TaxID=536979 RepID=UPI0031BA23C5
MKSIALLTLTLLLSFGTLFAQQMGGEPFKGAEKIIARYDIASDSLFNMLLKQITQHGYAIDRLEKDSMLIVTEMRPVIKKDKYKATISKYAMRLAIVDNTLTLSSACMYPDLKIKFHNAQVVPLVYYPKGYPAKPTFNEVLAFVRATNPASIAYAK